MHTRKGRVKGAVGCKTGGWANLVAKLVVSQHPSEMHFDCPVCEELVHRDEAMSFDDFHACVLNGVAVPGGHGVHSRPETEVDGGKDYEGEETEVIRAVKANPHLKLLPQFTMKMRYPVQCNLCWKKAAKKFAVFDLVNLKRKKFLMQHLDGPMHIQNLAQFNMRQISSLRPPQPRDGDDDVSIPEEDQDAPIVVTMTKCKGFTVEKHQGSKLYQLLEEFHQWCSYNQASMADSLEGSRNTYQIDLKRQLHTIIHHACSGEAVLHADLTGGVCNNCASLGNDRSLLRMVSKFYVKISAARTLPKRWGRWGER